jgi:hypothetical protein
MDSAVRHRGRCTTFWSPDSHSIAFFRQTTLMMMAVPDGAPEPLWTTDAYRRGATWSSRGLVLSASRGLWIGAAGSSRAERVLPYADPKGLVRSGGAILASPAFPMASTSSSPLTIRA